MTKKKINGKLVYECGCEFELNKAGGLIVDVNALPDCPTAWDLFCVGDTVEIFQCESYLVSSLAKRFKPRCMPDASALIAAARPGVLKAVVDEAGTKAIDLYIDIKNGEKFGVYIHPLLEPILGPTNSIIIYQEQILEIVKLIAGYSLAEADVLRKGIGKKNTQIVADCKVTFMAGAAKVGLINEEEARQLFAQIEKSARYSFNKSHSWGYAETAYQTAYMKAHFPKTFACANLYHAQNESKPLDEIRKLVQYCRRADITILSPSLTSFLPRFDISKGKIQFGLSDVKDISENAVGHMREVAEVGEKELGKPLQSWTWLEFLIFFASNQITLKSGIRFTPNSKSIIKMIQVGALDYPMYRQEMLLEYDRVWKELSKGQREWLKKNYNKKWRTLKDALVAVAPLKKEGGGSHDRSGKEKVLSLIKLLDNLPCDIKDTARLIAKDEKDALGIPLSCSSFDDSKLKSCANITCKEFLDGKQLYTYRLIGEVKRVKSFVCKSGQEMAFLTLDDNTCELESVTVFGNEYEQFEHLLWEGSIIYVEGYRDKNRGGFIVKQVRGL